MRSGRGGQQRSWALAVGLAAGLTAWELLLLRLLAGSEALGAQASRLAVDGLAFLLLAGVALWLGRRAAAVLRVQGRLVHAGLTALLLLLLTAPAAALRAQLLPAAASAATAGNAALDTRFLCTLALKPGAAAPEALAGPGALLYAGLQDALLLQAVALPLLLLGLRRRRPGAAPLLQRAPRGAVPAAVAALLGLTCTDSVQPLSGPGEAPAVSEPGEPGTGEAEQGLTACPAGMPQRFYSVSAIDVNITLNRFGDHDPGSFMYVLDQNISAVRAQEKRALPDRVSIGLRKDAIQPLVIRANLGDCVIVRFTNRLRTGRASLHVHGLPHSVRDAGGQVGLNPDTSVGPGQGAAYTFFIPSDPTAERAYHLHDQGDSRQRIAHGLFGALVVEPKGSIYRDPETGAVMNGSNWEAIIDVPAGAGPDFREHVLIYHEVGDEKFEGIRTANGGNLPVVDDLSGTYRPGARALNYRSEPFFDRLSLNPDESQAYGSYMFGDPGTPIPRSYLGEPTKMRVVHGGSEVFHVHHVHGGATRWRRNPKAQTGDFATGLNKAPPNFAFSLRLDSQAFGPGMTFSTEHECGAGGCAQAAGDFLFHCHIQHHYLAGMWSFWRVFDTKQPDLAVIPDRVAPPTAVDSRGLAGRTVEGKVLKPRAKLTNPATERALEDWIEAQLPPPGAKLDPQDATVWDWTQQATATGPLYLGEPETTAVWANYKSPTPGVRPPILFNPNNGRYAWPLMRPHLGQRPPFTGNGHTGAPWLGENGSLLRRDGLCPDQGVVPGGFRKRRTYPISTIAVPIPVSRSKTDVEGMLFVLNEDKAAVLAGTRAREPLVIRSNMLDCVDVFFTNEIPDDFMSHFSGEDDEIFSKTNLHPHFLQFDPQGSDGVITGMSFEQAVRPYKTEGRKLLYATAPGATQVRLSRTEGLRPGVWLGVGLGEGMCAPPGGGERVACSEVRRIAALTGDTVTFDQPLSLAHAAGQWAGVEFVRYNWYADVDDGTVFWHDHVTGGGWSHGLFGALIIEPAGSTWHDPRTGEELRSGPIADIHAPAGASVGVGHYGPFRELFLALSDEGGGGRWRENVEGGLLNLRSAPFAERGDSRAWLFSSVRHGDPVTPLGRAYLGDPFIIRGLGVTKNMTGLRVSGHRFLLEREMVGSPSHDTAAIGVSERFDLILQGGAGGVSQRPGDYLVHSTIAREFEGGAWGLLRVHDTLQPDLRPLPGRPLPASGAGFPQLAYTGAPPPEAPQTDTVCPPSAPRRHYAVRISNLTVPYHPKDPDYFAVAYTVNNGGAAPTTSSEPLVLRANQGECLEVALTNDLTERASLHMSEVAYDPQSSFGAAVGYNLDSTVAPGQTRLYRYFLAADKGIALAHNLANPSSGARGAYAALVVEPSGSTYRHSSGVGPVQGGVEALIDSPTGTFREMVLLFADEDERIGQDTMPYPDKVSGYAGINYRASPFDRRENSGFNVFGSRVDGDPQLVFRTLAGENMVLRVGQPWGEQQHQFGLDGHRWPLVLNANTGPVPGSEQVSSRMLVPGVSFDVHPTGGAGGDLKAPGDYLIYDQRRPFTEAGLWGLLRVLPPGSAITPASSPPSGGGDDRRR